jgi:hypothetical protein
MSFTIDVPSEVPSDFHNSIPVPVLFAPKNKWLSKIINRGVDWDIQLFSLPGLISRTSEVPPDVPSVANNSTPWMPSFATKYSLLLKIVKDFGELSAEPRLRSFTITVPSELPSVVHNSTPWMPFVAEKYSLLLNT